MEVYTNFRERVKDPAGRLPRGGTVCSEVARDSRPRSDVPVRSHRVAGFHAYPYPWPTRGRVTGLPVMAGQLTVRAMTDTNGPMTLLGIADPGTWKATDWVADMTPRLSTGGSVVLLASPLREEGAPLHA
jgi:hypothetical protein